MTRRILIATAMVSAVLLIALLAPTNSTQVVRGATATACLDCKSDCDAAATYCRDRAAQEMTYCRNQGYSFDYCKKVGNKHYTDCMSYRGCDVCMDLRMGGSWYCRCGRYAPFGGGSAGSGGSNIDPYYYSDPSDPSDPANDEDFSWYCELEPCACGADLPWCGN